MALYYHKYKYIKNINNIYKLYDFYIGDAMDIKQLIYFTTIVDEGNISAAAKKLHISQPPLSSQIHNLEDELGCVLFERGARKIQLTEAGDILYRRASALISMTDTVKREIKDYSSGMKGVLRLGVVSSVGNIALDTWLKPFHDKYPGVQYELCEANTYDTVDMLGSNLLEMAFVGRPCNDDGMDIRPVKKEKMYAVGSREFFENTEGMASIEYIGKKPLIVYKRWVKIFLDIFEDKGISPHIVCLNEDDRTTAFWAEKGMGIGIIPKSALGMLRNEEMVTLEIDDERMSSEIYLTAHKNTYRSSIASKFWEFVKTNIN